METRSVRTLIIGVIIFLILIAGFFGYRHFVFGKENRYRIENEYYGFELKTPKGWVGEEKTAYSEYNVAQLLEKCKSNKSESAPVYEIGAFKFGSTRYPDELISLTVPIANSLAGISSGAILYIEINCVPDNLRENATNGLYNSLQIGGEKAYERAVESSGPGKIRHISLLHNNLQYNVNEYTYISDKDKPNEEQIRENYAKVFDKIISSFKFVK